MENNSLSKRPQNSPKNNPEFFRRRIEASKERSIRAQEEYNKNPKICPVCGKVIPYEKRSNKFCSSSCATTNSNKNRSPASRTKQAIKVSTKGIVGGPYTKVSFRVCSCCGRIYRIFKGSHGLCKVCKAAHTLSGIKMYRQACKFNLNNRDHPELFDGILITEFGWYSPTNRGNNLNGVCWDHLYRIEDGFANGVAPEILRHPANAELIPWPINFNRKILTITLEELFRRIQLWDLGFRDLERFYILK